MHPYIGRNDCYYTDTDSLVLGSELPASDISSHELGKLKLEYRVKEEVFLASKSYCLVPSHEDVLVHKGAAKPHVDREWFFSQYQDASMVKTVRVTNPFRVDRKTMTIRKVESSYTLCFPSSVKRERVFKTRMMESTPLGRIYFSTQRL
jgi:hypothetical protein